MGFKLALSNEFIYRTNFLIGRLGEFVAYAALLYLFHALPQGAGGYDSTRLLTYVLGAALMSSVLFVYGMHSIADEITDGDLMNYLLRPIRYLSFWIARVAATRVLSLLTGIMGVGVLLLLIPRVNLFWQSNFLTIIFSVALVLGSLCIVQLLDLIAGLFAFWADRSHGPRWMVTVLILFLSGAYFPLDLFPAWVQTVLSYTPFPLLLFAPLKVYLGQIPQEDIPQLFILQGIWIVLFLITLLTVWKKGVKGYAAYGR